MSVKASNPLLSILVPSYQQARFLPETLASIFKQEGVPYEVIIMDGGSIDGSVDIIRQYESRIKVWKSEKDKGQSDALNKALQYAEGTFIGWQNSDDFYYPGAFAAFRSILEKDRKSQNEADVYFSHADVVDAESHILYRKYYSRYRFDFFKYIGFNITNQTAFFRRSKIEEAGGFDRELQHCMDRKLLLDLNFHGAKFRFVNQCWGAFRVHEDAKGRTQIPLAHREAGKLWQKYFPEYPGGDNPWVNPQWKSYHRIIARLRQFIDVSLDGNLIKVLKEKRKQQ